MFTDESSNGVEDDDDIADDTAWLKEQRRRPSHEANEKEAANADAR